MAYHDEQTERLRMRRPWSLGLVGVWWATTAWAQGLDPAECVRVHEVGERQRVRWSETFRGRHEMRSPDQPPRALEEAHTVEAVWVEEVVQVDGEGGLLWVRLEFEVWGSAGSQEDDWLQGKQVDFARETAEARFGWAVVESDEEASSVARQFLSELGRALAHDPVERVVLPPEPVDVGEVWLIELEEVRRWVPDRPALRGGEVRARVVGTADAQVSVEVQGEVGLQTLPGTQARLVDGGDFRFELTARWPRGGVPSQGTVEEHFTCAGVGEDQFPDGEVFRLRTRVERTRTRAVELLPHAD